MFVLKAILFVTIVLWEFAIVIPSAGSVSELPKERKYKVIEEYEIDYNPEANRAHISEMQKKIEEIVQQPLKVTTKRDSFANNYEFLEFFL